ncbi:MAG TPA: ABC transporter permease [Candidatus Limnocylindria bacterium]|nr:ABC transporter permease [Candidatus Limnocylindria bacterium]
MNGIFYKLRAFLLKRKVDAEMAEEMELHIEHETQSNIAAGMNPDEARRAARRQFGRVESIQEECREVRSIPWIENLLRDIRHGARMLRKNPGFTAVTVLTLGLCLGANLAIFAVMDAILLRPLPFPEPDRLVIMFNSYPKAGQDRGLASIPNYYLRQGNIKAFSHLAALQNTTAIIGDPGATELVEIARVSSDFFGALGVQPTLGRAFTEEEMSYQSDRVAILTDSFWRQQFNADPTVLGKTVRVDGYTKTIVGVLPPSFRYLSSRSRLFVPLSSDADERSIQRLHSPSVDLIGRLKPEATLEEAQAQIAVHDAVVALDFPDAKIAAEAGYRTVTRPLRADHVASIRPTLLMMQSGVLGLLLIGGVNLVNLLLIRSSSRSQELAIRQSLGATRRHVVGQVMTETLLLAVLGGALGLALGGLGIKLLATFGLEQLPLGAQVGFNSRLAVAAVAGSMIVGMFVAIPIAWFNLRSRLSVGMQSESRSGTATQSAQTLRQGFVVAQITLAFILLAGAGLLGISLKKAMAISPGFRADHVLTGRISLPWKNYENDKKRVAFADRLLEQVQQQPGVVSAGVATEVPLQGVNDYDALTVLGYTPPAGAPPIIHQIYGVTGDYFEAMGISLREGRYLNSADSHSDRRTCVVDQDFARAYWPQGKAIGQRFYRGSGNPPESEIYTVVGIVDAVKPKDLTDIKPALTLYIPYRQDYKNKVFLVVRTSGPPLTLGGALQKLVREIDPEMPIYDLRPMTMRIEDSLVMRRSPVLLAGVFAGVALLLAAIGTHGVVSFAVSQRRREIGVRMALGALPSQVLAQFVGMGTKLLVVGLVFGVLGAWGVATAMHNILFGVSSVHYGVLAITTVAMALVVLLAVIVPSLRAAWVNPVEALRD